MIEGFLNTQFEEKIIAEKSYRADVLIRLDISNQNTKNYKKCYCSKPVFANTWDLNKIAQYATQRSSTDYLRNLSYTNKLFVPRIIWCQRVYCVLVRCSSSRQKKLNKTPLAVFKPSKTIALRMTLNKTTQN